jgi:hypothetical protein
VAPPKPLPKPTAAPSPSPPKTADYASTAAKGLLAGAAMGLLGAVIMPKIFGLPTRPMEPSDLMFAGIGGGLGAGSYSFLKYMRKTPTTFGKTAACGAAGAILGILLNSSRIEREKSRWEQVVDKESGKPYYYNSETGQSSWEKPY